MSRLLHVLDGDATRPAFEAHRIAGRAVVWREALLEGPWPRALRGVDEAVAAVDEAAARDEEVVLWFDTDLFCRVHAAYFAWRWPRARFTNATGGHARDADLRALLARRAPLDPALADAWLAYAAPDPRGLVPLTGRFSWIRMHLARFPAPDDGLSAVERLVLDTLREGPLDLRQLLPRLAARSAEATDGLTDLALARLVEELMPLVARGPGGWSLTPSGADVLEGRADRWDAAPIERWLGGCLLGPGRPAWRWDGARLAPKP